MGPRRFNRRPAGAFGPIDHCDTLAPVGRLGCPFSPAGPAPITTMSNASICRLPGPSNQPIDGVLAAAGDRLPLSRYAGALRPRLTSKRPCSRIFELSAASSSRYGRMRAITAADEAELPSPGDQYLRCDRSFALDLNQPSGNDLPEQTASRHRQIRFRHSTRTGRPKHGALTNTHRAPAGGSSPSPPSSRPAPRR